MTPDQPMTHPAKSSDPSPSTIQPDSPADAPAVPATLQVHFKTEAGRVLLLLPPEPPAQDDSDPPTGSRGWSELWQQLKHRLNSMEQGWQPNTEVYLIGGGRLLDVRQLQEIAEALRDVQLILKRVQTTRRQTAVAAATVGYSVDQTAEPVHLSPSSPSKNSDKAVVLAEPLYLQTTLRSGMDVRHPGTVVILGDVNPGSSVVADGDIIIWGRLRGNVQAGSKGNSKSMIMALQMEPNLIRIADKLARGPESPPAQFQPEVAYITDQGIRISKAADFSKIKTWQIQD
ncbi:MAG: septum site-determining protein MinC [Oscillatoriales cyanobacterium RM2_1_1]|nr:septum site-determining protein MinC [Oscillatoriales cyanobacterium SM2_3_0]NJO45195.1 septum site-determining protein MinC [Oscillatoriales cyanobacterium RM2_1_1]